MIWTYFKIIVDCIKVHKKQGSATNELNKQSRTKKKFNYWICNGWIQKKLNPTLPFSPTQSRFFLCYSLSAVQRKSSTKKGNPPQPSKVSIKPTRPHSQCYWISPENMNTSNLIESRQVGEWEVGRMLGVRENKKRPFRVKGAARKVFSPEGYRDAFRNSYLI